MLLIYPAASAGYIYAKSVRKRRQAARTNIAPESTTAQLKTRPNKLKTGPDPAENTTKANRERRARCHSYPGGGGGGVFLVRRQNHFSEPPA